MEKQSSEEGERHSMDIDREIENIERSINKSVRSETQQEQPAGRESNSDDEDSNNKTIVDDFVGEIQ